MSETFSPKHLQRTYVHIFSNHVKIVSHTLMTYIQQNVPIKKGNSIKALFSRNHFKFLISLKRIKSINIKINLHLKLQRPAPDAHQEWMVSI